jgi:DNA-binding response OmpR family regulator
VKYNINKDIMKPKVLIVDDDPINIELLEGYLSKDYDILKAHDGSEAIIICKILKDDTKTNHIPIVIVTSLRETEDRNKAIEAGADDFITKPFDIIELSVRVKAHLRTKLYYDTMLGNASFQLHLLVL